MSIWSSHVVQVTLNDTDWLFLANRNGNHGGIEHRNTANVFSGKQVWKRGVYYVTCSIRSRTYLRRGAHGKTNWVALAMRSECASWDACFTSDVLFRFSRTSLFAAVLHRSAAWLACDCRPPTCRILLLATSDSVASTDFTLLAVWITHVSTVPSVFTHLCNVNASQLWEIATELRKFTWLRSRTKFVRITRFAQWNCNWTASTICARVHFVKFTQISFRSQLGVANSKLPLSAFSYSYLLFCGHCYPVANLSCFFQFGNRQTDLTSQFCCVQAIQFTAVLTMALYFFVLHNPAFSRINCKQLFLLVAPTISIKPIPSYSFVGILFHATVDSNRKFSLISDFQELLNETCYFQISVPHSKLIDSTSISMKFCTAPCLRELGARQHNVYCFRAAYRFCRRLPCLA